MKILVATCSTEELMESIIGNIPCLILNSKEDSYVVPYDCEDLLITYNIPYKVYSLMEVNYD